MVKETEKFDQEKRVWSTCFAHFWLVPEGDIGCLLALAGWYKPPTGFCHKLYEDDRARLLTCFAQGVSFILTSTP